jgi:uncharacterized protein YdgA (DUF945 family)
MRRVAVFAVAAVALLVVGLPPVLGLLTESQVAERVAALDASGVLRASLRSYERGWFRSRARVGIALAPQMIARLDALGATAGVQSFAGALDRRAPIEVEIAHGPFALLEGVFFGWSKIVARLDPQTSSVTGLERSLGVPYLFEFHGRTDFGGDVTFDADIPPVDLTIEGARVEFSGAALAGTFSAGRLVANGHLDRFELTSQPGGFAVHDVRAATDSAIRSPYALPGNSSLSIERIAIIDAARGPMPVFEADKIRVASKIGVDPSNALLDLHATYDVDSVFVDGTRIAAASVGVTLDKIDAVALAAYLEAARAEGSGAAPSVDLKPALARGLAAGPSLVLDPVHFTVNEEPFTAHAEVAANPAALPAAGTFDPEDPAVLLPALRSVATIDVSKKLARQIAVLATELRYGDSSLESEQERLLAEAQAGLILVTLVSQGILEDAGETYRAELRLTDGVLTLNGAALPFGLP